MTQAMTQPMTQPCIPGRLSLLYLTLAALCGCAAPAFEGKLLEETRVASKDAGQLLLGEPERVRMNDDNGLIAIPVILDTQVWNSLNPAVVTSVESYVNEDWNRIFYTLMAVKTGRLRSGNRPRIMQRLRPGEYEVFYVEPDGIHRKPVSKIVIPGTRR